MTDVALQPGGDVAEDTCCDVTHEHAVEADHHCGVATSLVPKLSVFLIHRNWLQSNARRWRHMQLLMIQLMN